MTESNKYRGAYSGKIEAKKHKNGEKEKF